MTKPSANELRIIPAVHMAAHAIALYVAEAKHLGISQAEAHVLAHLHERGPASVADIHARFGHRRSTLTSVIDRLADDGLVKRSPSTQDGRRVVLSVTARGKALAAKVHGSLLQLERRVVSRLAAADVATVEGALSTLAAAAATAR